MKDVALDRKFKFSMKIDWVIDGTKRNFFLGGLYRSFAFAFAFALIKRRRIPNERL
jgi:hypothetical protein